MNINYKDKICLDDKKQYVVASKINYEGNDFIYIVEIKNTSNIKFAKIEHDNKNIYIDEVNGSESNLLDKIIPLFFKSNSEILNLITYK